MDELWLIGIGMGAPRHVTLEGMEAIRAAGTILIPDKGAGKDDLAHLREAIIAHAQSGAEIRHFPMPVRDESLPYAARVEAWHDEIAARWQAALTGAGGPARGPVALLVWGDPGLYDSTLRIAGRLSPAPKIRVVPGITALQALTSAHAIPFNTVGGPVTITTGRNLRDHGWPEGAESVFVMLDGRCSFQSLDPQDFYIWWGGHLGMEAQVLEAGPLAQTAPRILETRARARAAHGWIMDTYLLRRG